MKAKLGGIIFLLFTVQVLFAQPVYDGKVLKEMIDFNHEMKTDRLLVSIKDTIILDTTFSGEPNQKFLLYSITKIFSGIAVGLLIDKQYIPHPEVPVSRFFEEWKDDTLKRNISIRHILQHTSGLAANSGSKDIYPQPDYVQYALKSPVITPPGTTFFYNNKAINIISGIVKKVTGQNMESFIRQHLFEPMGIHDYEWRQDAAGNTWAMDGLWMNAADLMKVGQMLCNYGQWNGKQLLTRQWCEMMFQMPLANTMNGKYGYAMAIKSLPVQEQLTITAHTIDTLQQLGLSAAFVSSLRKLNEKESYTWPEIGEKLKQLFSVQQIEIISAFASQHMIPLYTVINGNFYIKHVGEYGLLVTAFPKRKKVVVRFLGEKWGRKLKKGTDDYKYLADEEIVAYMLQL